MKRLTTTQRERRHARIRKTLSGTAARPRLSVHRSLTGICAQLIDDEAGKTMVSANTKTATTGDAGDRTGKTKAAYLVGLAIAAGAKKAGIEKAVFDRGGFAYHGRVKAVAEGARDGGLIF